MELSDLAASAASNVARFPEGMRFRDVNDGARELEAMIARDLKDRNMTILASGSGGAYAVTSTQTITSYYDGLIIGFRANHTAVASPTLNLNGLGAKSIVAQDGSALASGDIVTGQRVLLTYRADANNFQIVGGRIAGTGADVQARVLPVGTIIAWPTESIPAGWIECDGRALSRATYAALFATYGTRYGVGDGSTTFNLPDYRGYALRGWAHGATTDPDRASRTNRGDGTTGDNVGTKQTDATRSHTHTVSGATGYQDTSHTHTGTTDVSTPTANYDRANPGSANAGGGAGIAPFGSPTHTSTPTSTIPHTHTFTTGAQSANHAHTVTGTAAATGGNETRMLNANVVFCCLALPAEASAATIGVNGLLYRFDTGTTAADPGTGNLRFNAATAATSTALYISETGADGCGYGPVIDLWDNPAVSVKGTLQIYKVGALSTFAVFQVTGTNTDNGAWDTVNLTHVASNGAFGAADQLAVLYIPNGEGVTGPAGSDGGIRWTFSATTTMADPGTANLRLNNATLSSVTQIAISGLTAESGNPDHSDWVASWDDSDNAAVKGHLTLRNASGTAQAVYKITGAVTDNGSWLQFPVTHISSSGTLSSTLLVSFAPAGNKGTDGAGSGTVTSITMAGGLSLGGVGSQGGTVTGIGTITPVTPVNAQTGTSYTVVAGDLGKLITRANASAMSDTLPQATSSFGAGFMLEYANLGAGALTITPATSTINGAATLVLNRFESARIVSDGANWQVQHGAGLRGATSIVASAATCDIGAVASHRVSITGTTTITSFGTIPNQFRFVTFAGVLTLTHNATSLSLPGGSSLTTTAGDVAIMHSDGSGNWKCLSYSKADGTPIVGGSGSSGVNTNLVINGDFQVNGRAYTGGVIGAGTYGYDRWKASGGNAQFSISSYTLTISTGTIEQVVETTFWGYASLASTAMTLSVEAPSADLTVSIGSTSGTITAGSGRRSATLTTGAGDTGNISIKIAKATAGTVTFGRVKVEVAASATSWVARSVQDELMLCQRYLPGYRQVGTSQEALPGTAWFIPGSVTPWGAPFPVPPRVPPTGIVASGSSTFLFGGSGANFNGTPAFVSGSPSLSQINFTPSPSTAGQPTLGATIINFASGGGGYIYWTGCEL